MLKSAGEAKPRAGHEGGLKVPVAAVHDPFQLRITRPQTA